MNPTLRIKLDRVKTSIRSRLLVMTTDHDRQVRAMFPTLADEHYNLCVKELLDEGLIFASHGKRGGVLLRSNEPIPERS